MGWIVLIIGLICLAGVLTAIVQASPWLAAMAGIAWGINKGGFDGYGIALIILVGLAVYETNRNN